MEEMLADIADGWTEMKTSIVKHELSKKTEMDYIL